METTVPSRPSASWKLPRPIQDSLRQKLIRVGVEVTEDNEKQWRARFPITAGGATVTLYAGGTCTAAGKAAAMESAAEMVRSSILEAGEEDFLKDLLTNSPITLPAGPHIGCDESGKSDLFGPLVTAAIHADERLIKRFCGLGVRDCKDLSDDSVRSLAKEILQIAGRGVAVTCLLPKRYNEMYAKFKERGKTLNDLLAWAHARSIEELLGKGHEPKFVLVDRFSYHPIEALAQVTQGKIPVLEVYTAEVDFAVVAASIVARATFLEWMDTTSDSLRVALPKGTHQKGKVAEVARAIVERDGKENLEGLVKMNVKTMNEVFTT
jgi:ribonuclease HIII